MNAKELINTIFSYKKQYRNYISILFTLYAKRKISRIKDVNLRVYLRDEGKLIVPYGWVICSLYYLYSYKRDNILGNRYKGGVQRGFFETPAHSREYGDLKWQRNSVLSRRFR